MSILKIVASVIVAIGSVVMAAAIFSSIRTRKEVPGQLAGRWLTLSTLMVFFLLGYILFIAIQIYDVPLPLNFFVSIIFLAGSLFVYLVINLAKATISKLNLKANELAGINENLDHLVKQKTRELLGAMEQLQEEVITREEAEKKIAKAYSELDLIFNTVTEGMRVIDKDFVVVKANKTFEKLTSLNQDKIIGKKCYEIFPGQSCHTEDCPLRRIMQGETHIEVEVDKMQPDGRQLSCILTASPYRSPDGEFLGIIETFKDISNRIKMERELVGSLQKAHELTGKLEENQAELSEKNIQLEKAFDDLKNAQTQLVHHEKMASIGTLAGGIAHEFNNILGAILGFADMAFDESPEGSQAKADLEKVIKAGERAKELVKEILTFSRQSELGLSPLHLAPVIKEAIQLLRASTPSSVEVRTSISSDSRAVIANATMVHQVLVNLYTNAVQAMREKGVVEISLRETSHTEKDAEHFPTLLPGEYVELIVSDTGPGIDPEVKKRIFDPFFTTKELGKGTGMGLSVVHGIVERLGGLIQVESSPGRGTAFHVFFPVTHETVEEQEKSPQPIQTGTEHILFVDDDMMLAHMGKQMLERLGYRVSVRTSSVEAFEAFRAGPERFDLVITDQTMPNMNGDELAEALLQVRPDTPIILCTGYSSVVSEERAKEIGIRAFVMKPVEKQMLAKTIREVLTS